MSSPLKLSSSLDPSKVRLELPDIAAKIKALVLPPFDSVVGIATGGVVMASLLAFHLDLPLSIMHINFRAASNKPQRKEPELLEPFTLEGQQRVLLVDDVAVTGATFKLAKTLLQNHQISTLAIKGKADYVLFEALPSCILLPWRDTDRTT